MSTWGERYSGLRRPMSLLLKKGKKGGGFPQLIRYVFQVGKCVYVSQMEICCLSPNNNWCLVWNLTAKLPKIAQWPCAFTHVYALHSHVFKTEPRFTNGAHLSSDLVPWHHCDAKHGGGVGGCGGAEYWTVLHDFLSCLHVEIIWYRSTYRGWFLF